jgi:hypothetical protein
VCTVQRAALSGEGARMKDYEALCDFRNLYKAHLRARKGKRGTAECIAFELELPQNLSRLQEELRSRAYRLSGYYTFEVFDPKRRTIHALHYRDRVVQHCLCDQVLEPILDKRLVYDNAACRKGKGTDFARSRLSGFLREQFRRHGMDGYCLKCDVRKFFDHIDHDVLKGMLGKLPLDPDTLALLHHVIDSYHAAEGKGIPLGNQTSQWFALLYLNPLDRLAKERLRIRHYTRYMDDLVLLHPEKAVLRECLEAMRKLLQEGLRLELNEKTQIFPLCSGVEYLGFRFSLTKTGKVIRKLKTGTKMRFKKKLKRMAEEYRTGILPWEEIKQVLCSYRAHFAKGHCWRMQGKALGSFVLTRGAPQAEDNSFAIAPLAAQPEALKRLERAQIEA